MSLPNRPSLLLLPGDGIGPEVIAQVRRVAAWMETHADLDMAIEERPFGGASQSNDCGASVQRVEMRWHLDEDDTWRPGPAFMVCTDGHRVLVGPLT